MSGTMRTGLRVAALVVAVVACVTTRRTAAQAPVVSDLLDRYLRGDYDGVVAGLGSLRDFAPVLDGLRNDGPQWIESGGAATRQRRELTAATVALEAARLGEWNEWKTSGIVPGAFSWRTPPLLIEWGCARFRVDASPRPVERIWQLAALAVAERAEDPDFLLASPDGHLRHVWPRFPKEPRFRLAEALALEWQTFPNPTSPDAAVRALEALQHDEDVGPEATLRLGFLQLRMGDQDRAIGLFDRVATQTRDPWVIYLAHFFTGQAFEHKTRPADAERAFRAALAIAPHAPSASVALGTLLFVNDRRTEATEMVDTMLTARPRPADPWREYGDADDRFWPALIAAVRAEIRR